jgi:prepilin peptidase CpaA
VSIVFDALLVSFVTLAAGFDLAQRRIPNWLILLGAASGLAFNSALGAGVGQSALGFVLGLALLILPFALGWLGGGDVKFFAAVGAIVGVGSIPRVLLYTVFSGLLLATCCVLLRGVELRVLRQAWADLQLLVLGRGRILPASVNERTAMKSPYGVAIAAGTLVAVYLDPAGRFAGF